MRIERVTSEADVDAIVALETASFTNPWSRDSLVWELGHSDVTRVYVLRLDSGEVAAFCACWLVFDELHINTIAVHPDYRERGLGTALLRHVLAEADTAGARRATLEVRASNEPALRLYRALGFEVTATRPDYYTNPVEDALILWRNPPETSRGSP
jgi:ribosomal-protein-alanine N-acetyltransferase